MTTPERVRAAALDGVAAGLAVVPLYAINSIGTCQCNKRTRCDSGGKHPSVTAWTKTAPMTAEDVLAHPGWATGTQLADGLGVRTGTGSRVLVLDEDRVGALDELAALVGLPAWPATRQHRSGSGGRHLIYALTDDQPVPSLKLVTGADVLADLRQVVWPPTRSSKGAYVVANDLPIAPVPAVLLERLRRDSKPTTAPAPRTSSDAPVGDFTAYERGAVQRELARLDQLRRPWSEGAGWDSTTFAVACNLLDLADSAWTALTREEVAELVREHAPRDDTWGAADVEAKLVSAAKKVSGQGRLAPDLHVNAFNNLPTASTTATSNDQESTAVDARKTSKPEKDDEHGATAVVEHIHGSYQLGVTPAGETYAVPRTGPRLPIMLGERGGRLRDTVTAALYASTRRVPSSKAVDDALRVIVAQARAATVAPLHLRVATHEGGLVLDLAHPGSGACVHITATGWTVLDNPPADVLFRRTSATRPLPTPVVGGSLEPLRELVGLPANDRRWHLIRGWLVAALRPDVARPMLAKIGQPGSGKSTRGRLIVSVLDPTEELGSSLGRNLGDDQVRALARFLVSYDNLGALSDASQDHLCRLVSGEAAEKRQLYSDGDLYSITYRRTGVLTAVALPAMRPDTLERIIPIHLERFDGAHRRGESELVTAFADAHPGVLGGLFDAAVAMLAGLPAARAAEVSRPRWADYFDTLSAYDPACASAYLDSTAGAMAELAEDDPFIVAVRDWLAASGGSYAGDAATAWRGASRFAELTEGLPIPGPWWPRSSARFSAALEAAAEPLRAVGIAVERKRVRGARVLVLRATAAVAGG